MSYSSFIKETVLHLDTTLYNELRDVLVDYYLPVHLAEKDDLTQTMLAEKLCDYFEKIELKTSRPFEKTIEKYMQDLDFVVSEKIAKEPKTQRNKPVPPIPRARKYYDKACALRRLNKGSKHGLLDYTRIMLCLYMTIINGGMKVIDDFDYSLNELNINKIIITLRQEKKHLGKKPRFETQDPYTSDRSTFILLVILFYYMKSKEIVGEY